MDENRKAVIYALAACLIWGTVYVAIRVGLNHGFRPFGFAGVRFLLGGLILVAAAWGKGALKLDRRDFWVLFWLGLLQTGLQNALFFKGVELTNAGISAIFINTQPFFVILMAPLFFRGSRITPKRLAGLAVGFGGVLLTTYRHGLGPGASEMGILVLSASALTWAISNIAAKKVMVGRDTVTVTGVQMLLGAVPLLLTGWYVEGSPFSGVDSTGLMVLVYLVIFATSIPFLAWYKALALGEVGRVSVFGFTLPVLGVLSGWLILSEPLNWSIFFGMVMVAAGIVLVNRE